MNWAAMRCLASLRNTVGVAIDLRIPLRPLTPEVTGEPDGLSDETHDRLGEIDVEVVYDRLPRHTGGALGS